MGFSYYMPDIISVALITGAAALIPQGFFFWQTLRQAREAERDRRASSVRRACEGLYTTVSDLRTQIRTNHDYHGAEMRERLEKVWRYENPCHGTLSGQAATVGDNVAGGVDLPRFVWLAFHFAAPRQRCPRAPQGCPA
jgi:hypothetical protein